MPTGIYIRKPFTEEQKKHMSIVLIGNKRNLGHKHSEETKNKIRVANIGLKRGIHLSKEHKEKLRIINLGKVLSSETRNKISDATKKEKNPFWGKKHTEETRKKLREINLGKHHSEETKKKIGNSHRGEKAYQWIKDRTIQIENKRIRSSIEYQLWDRACMERDNFTCQKYGIKGCRLVVHHILNFSNHPELRFNLDNGITLSKKAHDEFHHIYGRKNNTREQLLEFLIN
jgi:5-methylcytosine-specific restriction endonuclease McrA